MFNQFASGVDTLLTEFVQGLTAPATRNTTTSRIKRGTEARESDDTSSEDSEESGNDTNEHNVDIERDKKKRMTREEDITRGNVESPLTKNVRDVAGEMENTAYDPSQGANFFGGARETEVCDNTSSGDPSAQFDTKSPSRSTSHLNLPSDSDMSSPDNNSPTDILVSLISEGNSQELEEKIRGSAAGLANRLCELKSTRPADIEQVVETGVQMVEYPLSDKLTAFLATGDQDEIDAGLAEELDDYERSCSLLLKKWEGKKCQDITGDLRSEAEDPEGEREVDI
ncbi:hypothetical protein ZWY2020_045163 [Hordeum vulgare]|nr:hypothetical protein ZWY2020_045163 [Hordeum vulgare]